jgi:hypothetical protein
MLMLLALAPMPAVEAGNVSGRINTMLKVTIRRAVWQRR